MKIHRIVPCLTLGICLAASTFPGLAASEPAVLSQEEARELYQSARRDLDSRRYQQAAEKFQRVVGYGAYQPDGALYWIAYAFQRMGRAEEALVALATLAEKHPESRWSREAQLLKAEIRPTQARSSTASQEDEDLKLVVINGLMSADREKAVPLLEEVIKGDHSQRLKERALFVLSQSGSERALEIMENIARGQGAPELQLKAVEYLGLFGGEESLERLESIYSESQSMAVKKRVLRALMLSGAREGLLKAAQGETVPELRLSAVRHLGMIGAGEELAGLYEKEQDTEVRKGILDAWFIGGQVDQLSRIAKDDPSIDLRRRAITKLGLIGAEETGTLLTESYRSSDDPSLRESVLRALFLQRNDEALIEIARNEKDPKLRRSAVKYLSMIGSDAATEFMLEILKGK